MSQEVPVYPKDILALIVVAAVGGFVIAAALRPLELSPGFVSSIFAGAVLIAFFLFIPVLGLRMFVEDWKEEEDGNEG